MSFSGYKRFILNLGLIVVFLGTSLTAMPVEASPLLLGDASVPSARYGDPATCISGPITVVNLQNSGAGSLRQAITDICSGGTINFDSSLSGQIILLSSSSLPAIDKTLMIDGGSGESVILSGAGSYRIFEVTSAGNLTFNNLKLQDGNYTDWCSGGLPGAPACAGGSIYSEGGLTVTNSTFSANSADAGGAIFIAAGTAEISNSTFANNLASQGGALFTWTGTAAVLNSTFFANSATYGGAAYNETATLSLSNNTFSNNSATYGGGLYNVGILNLANNILANSPSGADCFNEDGAGIVVTDVGNLVEVNADATNNCGTPAVTGDPNLGPLAHNGGFTRTMALLSGSPAIDAGDTAVCPAADQRGISRPQGSGCDIGAFEFVTLDTPTPTLTSTVTSTPSPTLTPTATLAPSSNSLYVSFSGSLPVEGTPSANEDILYFDGASWNQFFDGSDVGLASADLTAFYILDEDTILMSFASAFTVDGIDATPQDILRLDASSLGSATLGTFSLYFDGSDVGLDNTASEEIDALSVLTDGRLLISTSGNPSVPDLTTGKDEDVLAFTPASLGEATSGTWSMYFDGSDVGLSDTNGEDVDAFDVVGDTLYLSTRGNFSVSGVSGAMEDVFVCTATSLGDVTACTYSPSLYFDGSTWGSTVTNVDGFQFPVFAPVPTVTPTSAFTPTNVPTATLTSTPTPTATFVVGSPLTFTPLADAYVTAGSPASNYGSSTTLRTDASPDIHSYLRFEVQGLSGIVTKATLRVYANSTSSQGCTANAVSDNTWSESTINYNNAPSVGSALASSSAFGGGAWIEIDVTTYITGNGTYNLALTTPSSTAISFASRETANTPQLIVETSP